MNAPLQAWAEQEDARLQATIRKNGWSIEYIGGGICSHPGCDGGDAEGPALAHTVGLFGLGHPELLVFGLGIHDTSGLLNSLGEEIRAGENLIPGIELTVRTLPNKVVPPKKSPPWGDCVHCQPVLSTSRRVFGARSATQLRRRKRPVPLG